MVTEKKIKLKKPVILILKIIGIFLAVFIGLICFYRYNINEIKKLGYSEKASNKILFNFKKKYVIGLGKNKTLNAAFESDDYIEENLDSYSKITYRNQPHLIKNINILIKKKYSNSDISIIISHGSDKDISEFAKKNKVRYLEEFFTLSYAKIKYYDRYVLYSDETGEDEETTVLYVNLNMDKDDYSNPIVIDKYNKEVLVNKHRQLSKKYVPADLVDIDEKYASDNTQKGVKDAVNAFIQMSKAAEKQNFGLIINSSYRSYEEQEELCNTYANLYGQDYVNKYVAKPGFSEHQTGFSFDIGSKSSNVFANSSEYEWIQNNSYKYGFIQRYPKKFENITGFRNESWHYRYVGKDIAKYIYEHNISFEEYYMLFLDN